MKKVTINKYDKFWEQDDHNPSKTLYAEGEELSVSDGYHTFEELYDHRIELYIALCRLLATKYKLQINGQGVWRSELHSDGTSFDGWFVLGILTVPGQQITYHLPENRWKETDFAYTLDKAPEFDGHTPEDVLKRLKRL